MLVFLTEPAIKNVPSKGREGVKAKAHVYCFYDVILLFRSVQGGGGVLGSPNLSVRTLWMVPKVSFLTLLFSYYKLLISLMMLHVKLLSMLMKLLYTRL